MRPYMEDYKNKYISSENIKINILVVKDEDLDYDSDDLIKLSITHVKLRIDDIEDFDMVIYRGKLGEKILMSKCTSIGITNKILLNLIIWNDNLTNSYKKRIYIFCICIENGYNKKHREISYECYLLKGHGNLKKKIPPSLIPYTMILGSKKQITCKKERLKDRLKNFVSGYNVGSFEVAKIDIREL